MDLTARISENFQESAQLKLRALKEIASADPKLAEEAKAYEFALQNATGKGRETPCRNAVSAPKSELNLWLEPANPP